MKFEYYISGIEDKIVINIFIVSEGGDERKIIFSMIQRNTNNKWIDNRLTKYEYYHESNLLNVNYKSTDGSNTRYSGYDYPEIQNIELFKLAEEEVSRRLNTGTCNPQLRLIETIRIDVQSIVLNPQNFLSLMAVKLSYMMLLNYLFITGTSYVDPASLRSLIENMERHY